MIKPSHIPSEILFFSWDLLICRLLHPWMQKEPALSTESIPVSLVLTVGGISAWQRIYLNSQLWCIPLHSTAEIPCVCCLLSVLSHQHISSTKAKLFAYCIPYCSYNTMNYEQHTIAAQQILYRHCRTCLLVERLLGVWAGGIKWVV